MSELSDIVDGLREAFDARREVFFENDSCFLLTRSDGSDEIPFRIVMKITSGWIISYAETRGQFELSIADFDASVGDKISTADSVAADGNIYEIERGDTLPPCGEYPVWLVFCKSTGEKFSPVS